MSTDNQKDYELKMSALNNSFDKQIAAAPATGPVNVLTFDVAVSILYHCLWPMHCAVLLYRLMPAHTLYLSSPTVITQSISV